MNEETFEQRLSRIPRTVVPPGWKSEILAVAREAAGSPAGREVEGEPGRGWRWRRGGWWGAVRGVWEWATGPCGVLVGGCAAVVVVQGLAGWIAERPESARNGGLAEVDGIGALVAARQYQSEVQAWLSQEDGAVAAVPVEPVVPSGGEGRPRGQWEPVDQERSGRLGEEERSV